MTLPSILLYLLAASLAGGEAKPAWTMPVDQRQAVMAVVEKAMACGLPDARGGQLFAGKLGYALAKDGSSTTTSFDGLHIRLADRSWLVHLMLPVVPVGTELVLDAQALKPLTPETLKTRGEYFNRRWMMDRLIPSQRAMYRAAADIDAILTTVTATRWKLDGLASLYLIRLGVPGSELAPISLAEKRLYQCDDDRFWVSAQPLFLGPTGACSEDRAQWFSRRWEAIKTPLTLADPATALRRSLFAEAVYAATAAVDPYPEQAPLSRPLPLATAIALGDAMLADDEVEAHRHWERIKAGLRLPSVGADFPSCLAVWRGGPRNAWNEDFDRQVRSSRGQKAPQEEPFQATDLDTLVALCGDGRPSLWFDHLQARTVGDQALRAISDVFQMDVRRFIGRDVLAPWTDQERTTTAATIQEWWRQHRQQPVDEILARTAPVLTLRQLAGFLQRTDDAHHRMAFDQLAQAWAEAPSDVGYDDEILDRILAQGLDHAAFAARVDAWKAVPETRLVLAAWQLVRGHPKDFDAWLADAVAHPAGQNAGPGGLRPSSGIPGIMAFPTVERMRQVRLMMASEPLDEPAQDVIWSFTFSRCGAGQALVDMTRSRDPAIARRERAIHVLFLLVGLDDRRPAPRHQMVKLTVEHFSKQMVGHDRVDVTGGKPAPKDLRVADCVATCIANQAHWYDLRETPLKQVPNRDLLFDFCAPIAERDAGIARLRQRLADLLPGMLTAAQLPADLLKASDPVHKAEVNF